MRTLYIAKGDGGTEGNLERATIDVTNMSSSERARKLSVLKTLLPEARYYEHYCYHDETPAKQCAEVEL